VVEHTYGKNSTEVSETQKQSFKTQFKAFYQVTDMEDLQAAFKITGSKLLADTERDELELKLHFFAVVLFFLH
jgi:hypothetical protein